MRQVGKHFRGLERRPLKFSLTPTMTVAHVVFASATIAYILIALQFEERDLVEVHGRDFIEHRKRTPMLVPSLGGGGSDSASGDVQRNAA